MGRKETTVDGSMYSMDSYLIRISIITTVTYMAFAILSQGRMFFCDS